MAILPMAGRKHYKKAYRDELLQKIEQLDTQVFTRSDIVRDRSNREQLRLNRALKAFIDDGFIAKIGHGIYAKAMLLELPDGRTHTVLRAPFESVATEALNRSGVKWELGKAIQEYNRGESTQIPAIFSIKLHSRYRGTISAEGRRVVFEGGSNAR